MLIVFKAWIWNFQVSHIECVLKDEAEDFVEDDTTHG